MTQLGKGRLTAIGVKKSQSLILDGGDHLESVQREAEFVNLVEEIHEKQREEDRQKKQKETSELHATADDTLKKFIGSN